MRSVDANTPRFLYVPVCLQIFYGFVAKINAKYSIGLRIKFWVIYVQMAE